ncbi:MAG: hypothetical protein E6H65_01605 [Betaproteobacteria bacterium]|nr:MAG: hypothetical protein E6H65_01605 [Betaproteobacteria bacterium]
MTLALDMAGALLLIAELGIEGLQLERARIVWPRAKLELELPHRQTAFVPAARLGVGERDGHARRLIAAARLRDRVAAQRSERRGAVQRRQIEVLCARLQLGERPGVERPQRRASIKRLLALRVRRLRAQRCPQGRLLERAGQCRARMPQAGVGAALRELDLRLQRQRRMRADLCRAAGVQSIPGGDELVDAMRLAELVAEVQMRSHAAQRLVAERCGVELADLQQRDVELDGRAQIGRRMARLLLRRLGKLQVDAARMQLGHRDERAGFGPRKAQDAQAAPAESAHHDLAAGVGQKELDPLGFEVAEQRAPAACHLNAGQFRQQPRRSGIAAHRPPEATAGRDEEQQEHADQCGDGPGDAALQGPAQNEIPTLKCKRILCTRCP